MSYLTSCVPERESTRYSVPPVVQSSGGSALLIVQVYAPAALGVIVQDGPWPVVATAAPVASVQAIEAR